MTMGNGYKLQLQPQPQTTNSLLGGSSWTYTLITVCPALLIRLRA